METYDRTGIRQTYAAIITNNPNAVNIIAEAIRRDADAMKKYLRESIKKSVAEIIK